MDEFTKFVPSAFGPFIGRKKPEKLFQKALQKSILYMQATSDDGL